MKSLKRFLPLLLLIGICVILSASFIVMTIASKPAEVSNVTLLSEDTGVGVTWKGQAKAEGYQILISTSSDFEPSESKTLTDTSCVFSSCNENDGLYYAKVRAYRIRKGKEIYGKWSKTQAIMYMKPTYSVTCNLAASYEPYPDLIDAFLSAGARITVVDETVDPTEYDGLILPGGVDLDPSYYGEKIDGSKKIDHKRDAREMAVLDKFISSGKPILGICRGGQILNVYFGGTLYQDIGTDHTNNVITSVVPSDKALDNSILYDCYGSELSVVCSHHQSIKDLGEGFIVTQYSTDGIIEALEHETLPIIVLQWHPERMPADDQDIIHYFIDEMVNKQVE